MGASSKRAPATDSCCQWHPKLSAVLRFADDVQRPSRHNGRMGTTKLVDELTPIASYMAKEMNTNALGADYKRMADLNAFSSQRCIDDYLRAPWWQRLVGIQPQQCVDMELSSGAAALLLWTSKVMQDADWYHKPKLRKKFLSPTTKSRVWHTYGPRNTITTSGPIFTTDTSARPRASVRACCSTGPASNRSAATCCASAGRRDQAG